MTSHLGDHNHPGVKEMVERLKSTTSENNNPDSFVDACIDTLGLDKVSEDTRIELVNVAREVINHENEGAKDDNIPQETIIQMFKLIGSCREYQLC